MTHVAYELQLDGLVGPTHHFGGLSFGNRASMTHAGWQSRPRQAALQGLAKMRQVLAFGMLQAVLPPLMRPDIAFLRQLGFRGSEATVLQKAARDEPALLRIATSSAFMWAANAATVIPSSDSTDGRCHIVVANLAATSHRSLEGSARAALLHTLFPASDSVVIHDPLPTNPLLGDEGAANHCRIAPHHGAPGWHLFVYGRAADVPRAALPRIFPARQSREASQAVARLGQLQPSHTFFARQSPSAIDVGAFHNDVVMVNDCDRILLHQRCFVDQENVLATLKQCLPRLRVFQVSQRALSLRQAVQSYLFNSQLLRTPNGIVLLAPAESSDGPAARVVQRLLDDGFIDRVQFQELSQSMAGGGGPACLRLRLPLTQEEIAQLVPGVLLDETKLQQLEAYIHQHYRDELQPADLADPHLLEESQQALDAFTQLLGLGSIYPFQRATP